LNRRFEVAIGKPWPKNQSTGHPLPHIRHPFLAANALRTVFMTLRVPARTLADLRTLLAGLQKKRHDYNPVYFAQLRRILRRRIVALTAELRGKHTPNERQRAA